MNRILSLLGVYALSISSVMAAPSERDVQKLQNKVSSFIMAMDGVNGNGITDCATRTGRATSANSNAKKEPCLMIYAENDDAVESLESLFPSKTRVDGILVVVKKIGVVRPE